MVITLNEVYSSQESLEENAGSQLYYMVFRKKACEDLKTRSYQPHPMNLRRTFAVAGRMSTTLGSVILTQIAFGNHNDWLMFGLIFDKLIT